MAHREVVFLSLSSQDKGQQQHQKMLWSANNLLTCLKLSMVKTVNTFFAKTCVENKNAKNVKKKQIEKR